MVPKVARWTPQDILDVLGKLFHWTSWRWGIAAVIACLANFVAEAPTVWRGLLVMFIVFFVLDIVTGIVASVRVRQIKVSSRLFGRSLVKMLCYSTVLLIATMLDYYANCRYAVSLFVLALAASVEGLSVLENTRALWEGLGLKWPFKFLSDKIERLAQVPEQDGDEPR